MVVYILLAVLFGLLCSLFATNVMKSSSEDLLAKKYMRIGGSGTCSLFSIGFLFMAFYDLSVNLSNELMVLEGFGLFSLLFAVLTFIFTIFLYHNRLIEYSKIVNENNDEQAKIKETCEKLDDKEKIMENNEPIKALDEGAQK